MLWKPDGGFTGDVVEMDRLVEALIEEETLQGSRFMDLAGLA